MSYLLLDDKEAFNIDLQETNDGGMEISILDVLSDKVLNKMTFSKKASLLLKDWLNEIFEETDGE